MSGRATVIGAGIGGLCAAVELAIAGWAVTMVERAGAVGGKMREVETGDVAVDGGPTVLTMPWVFEAMFARANTRLADYAVLERLDTLARHAWRDGSCLDLFADRARSADAIGNFASAHDARGYLAFCSDTQRMYDTLRRSFLESSKPNPMTLAGRIGVRRLGDLLATRPFDTMWSALGDYFRDPRLRQLFGRYATYCGSSPFAAPATLMLVAHVEQDGVWSVRGGMQRLAEALATLARDVGVNIRLNTAASGLNVRRGRIGGVRTESGELIMSDVVVCNADPAALSAGLFGADAARAVASDARHQRSLSAITWTLHAQVKGFQLARHNVFFSDDYVAEFAALQQGLAKDPTIYVCAQDRMNSDKDLPTERLLLLANAPAHGDRNAPSETEIDRCETNVMARLRENGLMIEARSITRTTPAQFNQLFPATGGALYGRASHGWMASFLRQSARTRLPGLYMAGGATHPGAGVPMAALSGRLAAQTILKDRASTSPFRRAATRGGTSTRLAKTPAAG